MGDIEAGWRYCKPCKILYWGGHAKQGDCVQGGQHAHNNENYGVHRNQVPTNGEPGWRYCRLCMGLFWKERADKDGKCVTTGGKHEWNDDKYAALLKGSGGLPAEDKWGYCKKCGALFWNGWANDKGKCATGGQHQSNGDEYFVIFTDQLTVTPPPTPGLPYFENHFPFWWEIGLSHDNVEEITDAAKLASIVPGLPPQVQVVAALAIAQLKVTCSLGGHEGVTIISPGPIPGTPPIVIPR